MGTIKVETKSFGKAAGTTGWLTELLKNAEIKVGRLKGPNVPAIFLEYLEGEKKVSRFVAQQTNMGDDSCCFMREREGISYVDPEKTHHGEGYGIFEIVLTPACEKAVESLIQQCVDILKDLISNDPEIEITVTANVKE